MPRQLTWLDDGKFEGWTCSECAWTYPIPELLSDLEAKNAYDRIASANFSKHACRAIPEENPSHEGNIQRLRKSCNPRNETQGGRRNHVARSRIRVSGTSTNYKEGPCR